MPAYGDKIGPYAHITFSRLGYVHQTRIARLELFSGCILIFESDGNAVGGGAWGYKRRGVPLPLEDFSYNQGAQN